MVPTDSSSNICKRRQCPYTTAVAKTNSAREPSGTLVTNPHSSRPQLRLPFLTPAAKW